MLCRALLLCSLLQPTPAAPTKPFAHLSRLERDPRLSPIISYKHKFIYCDIPKCGVSRWRRLCRRAEGITTWADKNAHYPYRNKLTYLSMLPYKDALQAINDPSLYSFVIVRSPYTRLLSAWLDKKNDPQFKLPQTFHAYVLWLENQTVSHLNEHFKPMSSFCNINNGMEFDLIARIEDLHVWGPKLIARLGLARYTETQWKGGFFRSRDPSQDTVAHNQRSEEKLTQYYTPALMQIIDKKYHKDFVHFGYQKGKLMHCGASVCPK